MFLNSSCTLELPVEFKKLWVRSGPRKKVNKSDSVRWGQSMSFFFFFFLSATDDSRVQPSCRISGSESTFQTWMCRMHLEILLTCRFWLTKSGVGPEILSFYIFTFLTSVPMMLEDHTLRSFTYKRNDHQSQLLGRVNCKPYYRKGLLTFKARAPVVYPAIEPQWISVILIGIVTLQDIKSFFVQGASVSPYWQVSNCFSSCAQVSWVTCSVLRGFGPSTSLWTAETQGLCLDHLCIPSIFYIAYEILIVQ